MYATGFACRRRGHRFSLKRQLYRCPKDGSGLDITYDYPRLRKLVRREIDVSPKMKISHWKYWMFYPVGKPDRIITMGEGGTEIVPSIHVHKALSRRFPKLRLFFKNEGTNPTGSFKDRGSTVELTVASRMRSKTVFCATTGNMGASVAAYSARAGVPSAIFLPKSTPAAKLSQIASHGASIKKVGSYEEAASKAASASKRAKAGFLSGDYAYRGEGEKSVGFELLDQFHLAPPSAVFVPMGNGRLIYSVYKAFLEFEKVKLIQRMPKLIGVQAEGAAPIVKAFERGLPSPAPQKRARTIASAIAVADPVAGGEALEAIRKSNGFAVSVSDREILQAASSLGKEGLYAEPAGAASLAGLTKASKDRRHSAKMAGMRNVVALVTGHGLKGIR